MVFTGNTKYSTVSIGPLKSKTPSSSLCSPITGRGHFTTLSYSYCQRRLAKLKIRHQAPEPQWSALWILFGEWHGDDSDEDESIYFDRAGTCLDDEWVNTKAPRPMTRMETPRLATITMSNRKNPLGTGNVNTQTRTVRRPATSGFATLPPQSPNKDVNTPSSVVSNDPDIEENTPSPYTSKYLRRRQPKKPKF
ncbi:hypothetical protein Salat_1684700 [Sesamum alatum]|uniref:Uncharacterized protein n=1 Tax=Sesamum alatum TaxID=300844 RepID=A0AAE2CJW8_9LAMI|nr:hypothetical protein Salat_1684700 [Sesamum alatum]